MTNLALVYVLNITYSIDKEYTYICPSNIKIMRGSFVLVPFGNGDRKLPALVTKVYKGTENDKMKTIISSISSNFIISDDEIELAEYVKKTTFCTFSDALKRIIPYDYISKIEVYYECLKDNSAHLKDEKKKIFDYLISSRAYHSDVLKNFNNPSRHLKELEKMGYIKPCVNIREPKKDAKEIYAYANTDFDKSIFEKKNVPSSYKQIYDRISDANIIPINELQSEGFNRAQIKAMENRGFIKFEEREKLRIPYSNFIPEKKEYVLSVEQTKAFNQLKDLSDKETGAGALLYGVTGSGKSQVILSLCKYITSKGKTAIILVPEIALTWQCIELYMQYYGKKLAVIHSALSDGEKYDSYKRIMRGEASVVLGTRSAVFAPLKNIGLIVLDEEQEHTYKSELTPKYHACEVAKFRIKQSNGLLLLSSATPSIESYYRAKKGIYSLVTLKNRYNGEDLPHTIVSDMRKDELIDNDKPSIIGKTLSEMLIANNKEYKQSLILLNRRGYSSFVICHKCGETVMCPHCSSALTYHKKRNGGMLVCHLCGYMTPMVKNCPSCSSEHITYEGYGTQSLEDNVKTILPNAKILRMDADTVKGKNSRDEIISSFEKGEYDVLIGTQMIAKGHNFPYVTLSSCVGIDASLYSNDFRASERTFDLLTQLEGRSGRSEDKGVALIQTYSPNSEIIKLAKKQDYEAFYNSEIVIRKNFTFPPFCDMAIITLTSEKENELIEYSHKCSSYLSSLCNKKSGVPMQIFGPIECPIYKLKNNYRMRIVVKHKFNDSSREIFNNFLLFASKENTSINVNIDINPTQT